MHIDNLPSAYVSELTLEERIITEEAWKNLKTGNITKAEKIISRLGPQSPFYHVGLGYTCFVQNQYEASLDNFKKALLSYPDMGLIHLGLAQLYQNTGQRDQAFNEYSEVLKGEPDHPWAKKQFESLGTTLTDEYLVLGRSILSQGKTEEGKEAFLKALHYSPKSIPAHLELVRIYRKEKSLQNALIHLKLAYGLEPKNPEVLREYGEALYDAGEYPQSLGMYERLAEVDPKNKEVQSRLDSLKTKLGIFELPSQFDSISASEAVTKEDVAALLGVKFKDILEEAPPKPPVITDIATSWASRFILKAATLGLLDVYSNHTFQPKKIVSRAEMAEVLIRLVDLLKKKGYRVIQQIPPDKIQISDVSPDNYYYVPILQVLSYQIMELSSERSFNPEQSLSGSEALKIFDITLALIR
jgi:Tfp pilus assembly protein PilF